MLSILRAFYQGNIKPVDRDYQQNENSKQFRVWLQEQNEINDQLTAFLNAEQFANVSGIL